MCALPTLLKLRGDTFTEPSRTPWGGDRVAAWKRARGIEARAPLGESWEVSFGPELPSYVAGGEGSLAEMVAAHPGHFLGDEAALGTSALLVKLLDAREPLSVQIHPADDDPSLGPDESGKPECWYVAAADPGAVILFGLAEHASPAAMRAALQDDGDVAAMLERFEVAAGDFFVVPPGTPHAIGAGVTVVEPQRVSPGKRGVTYRYWDHRRRYDAQGRLDPAGAPRALHVEDALRVTDWESARGAQLARRAYRRVASEPADAPLSLTPLSGRDAIPFPVEVALLRGTGSLALPASSVGRALTVVGGELELGEHRARAGESIFLAAHAPVVAKGRAALAILAATPR